MTIPIRPGPFSILAYLGQAGGEAFSEAEKKRKTDFKEAQDLVNQMITMRAAGILPPEAFGSEQAMGLYKRLGIPAISTKPTSAEMKEDITSRSLAEHETPGFSIPTPGLIPGTGQIDVKPTGRYVPTRQKIAAGVPLESQIKYEETVAPKLNTAAGAKADLSAAQDIAALPGAATTVVAEQQGKQDTTFDSIADRVVADLYQSKGELPTTMDAYMAGQGDLRAKQFGKQITQPYYGAAIRRLWEREFMMQTQRIAAAARYAGAAGTGLDDVARVYLNQATILNNQLTNLKKTMGIQDSDAGAQNLVDMYNAQGVAVPEMIRGAADRYNRYEAVSKSLFNRINGVMNHLEPILGGTLGTATPGPLEGTTGASAKEQAQAEYRTKAQGITDMNQLKKIAAEVAAKYKVQLNQTP